MFYFVQDHSVMEFPFSTVSCVRACLWARMFMSVCVCVCVCVCVLFQSNRKWELVRMFSYLFRLITELSVRFINHLPMTAPKSLNTSNSYKFYSGGVCIDDAEIHFVFTCQKGSNQPDSPASCCLLSHKLAIGWASERAKDGFWRFSGNFPELIR